MLLRGHRAHLPALAGAPLALITKYKVGEPDYDQWVEWGNDILVTGIFAIIICGTLGTLLIHLTAPRLLTPAEGSVSGSEESEDGIEAEVEEVSVGAHAAQCAAAWRAVAGSHGTVHVL